MKEKVIVGINLSHDCSCAVIINGEVKVAIEEERLNRIKHFDGKTDFGKVIPFLSIYYCLDYLKINPQDVDLWMVNACFPHAIEIVKTQLIGIPDERIRDVELPGHHLSHAYSAFYPSPFDNAAVLVFDVNGGYYKEKKENYSIYSGTGETLKPVWLDYLSPGEISMAELYLIYAAILQLSPWEDGDYGKDDVHASGGKLMGYSSFIHFGKTTFYKELIRGNIFSKKTGEIQPSAIPPIMETDNHHYVIKIRNLIQYLKQQKLVEYETANPNYDIIFGWDIKRFVRWKYRKSSLKEKENIKMGGEAQLLLEHAIIEMARLAYEKTMSENLCLAGGTMLNVVAVNKILKETPFKNVFVQPAANDAGNAIGAALYGYYEILREKGRPYLKKKYLTYLGKEYSAADVEKALNRTWALPFKYQKIKNTEEQINILLSNLLDDRIIAVCRGRSEFGPRALGNRSFLASPANRNMLDRMNELKNRAWYRPVAPVVLKEELCNYFQIPVSRSPYMTINADCLEKTIQLAPAICHVDGSARVQTVEQDENPFLYQLLKAFFQKTGIPILINTSFNVREPIVESPEHAINTFLENYGLVKCMALEDYILEVKEEDF